MQKRIYFSMSLVIMGLLLPSCLKRKNSNDRSTQPAEQEGETEDLTASTAVGEASSVRPIDAQIDASVLERLEELGVSGTEQVLSICESNLGRMQNSSFDIVFPETRGCRFGEAGNLEPKDQHIQAISLNQAVMEAPQNSVICNVNLQSQSDSNLEYDDYFVLSLDEFVIVASNNEIVSHLQEENSLYLWDQSAVIGKPLGFIQAPSYCLPGLKECQVPQHEELAPVSVVFDTNSLAPLTLALAGRNKIALNLLVTGDNDETDCYHKELSINVKMDYFTLD